MHMPLPALLYRSNRSLSTLLGTRVHLLIHVIFSLANRVAAVQCITSCRYRSGASIHVHINHQNGEEM